MRYDFTYLHKLIMYVNASNSKCINNLFYNFLEKHYFFNHNGNHRIRQDFCFQILEGIKIISIRNITRISVSIFIENEFPYISTPSAEDHIQISLFGEDMKRKLHRAGQQLKNDIFIEMANTLCHKVLAVPTSWARNA